jgi:hypothetical protein
LFSGGGGDLSFLPSFLPSFSPTNNHPLVVQQP